MRRYLTENLPLKIISVVVALVLYLFVMVEKEGEKTYTIPVVVEAQPEGYVLLTEIPDLTVVVSGRTRHLARLEADELQEMRVELDRTQPLLTFSPADFDLPAGVEIQSITPNAIQLSYARLTSREVPIVPNIRGHPHADYSVVEVRVNPDRIRVEGPEDAVEELDGVFTAPIDIYESDTEDIVRPSVELIPIGSYIDYDRSVNVSVTIAIEPNEDSTQVTVPVALEGPVDRFSLEEGSDYVNVWLIGPPSVIHGTGPIPLQATVDTTAYLDASAGRYFVEPRIFNLPPGVRVEHIQPPTLPLVVAESPAAELRAIPIPVPAILPLPLPRILAPPAVP